jgi:hypothetical protein
MRSKICFLLKERFSLRTAFVNIIIVVKLFFNELFTLKGNVHFLGELEARRTLSDAKKRGENLEKKNIRLL